MHPFTLFSSCFCFFRSGGKCIEAASTHMSLTNTFFSLFVTLYYISHFLISRVYIVTHQLVCLNAWYRMCTVDTLPALVAIGPGTWKIN